MAESPLSTFSAFLAGLRHLPGWILAGIALAGWAVLFVPASVAAELAAFRTSWGHWAWIDAITFSALFLARLADAGVNNIFERRREALKARGKLRLVPRSFQSWWSLAKQPDGTYVTQMRLDFDATNLTSSPLRILNSRLVHPRPKSEVIDGSVFVPIEGTIYHSSEHPVPPNNSIVAESHIMVRGTLARQGRPLRVTLGVTDQFGYEHKIAGVVLKPMERAPARLPWRSRFISILKWTDDRLAKAIVSAFRGGDRPVATPTAWLHRGEFLDVELILAEEQRRYEANGRYRGGLGSLNVGIQSEPGGGVTQAGAAPSLLWDKGSGKKIDSENVVLLLKLHEASDPIRRQQIEQFLLSHLNRVSEFANVTYFIFLALHRMGQTMNALRSAQADLVDDKVMGYSNLQGALSAIISHEHFQIDTMLLQEILMILAAGPKPEFRLKEKIGLACLLHLNEQLSDTSPQGHTA